MLKFANSLVFTFAIGFASLTHARNDYIYGVNDCSVHATAIVRGQLTGAGVWVYVNNEPMVLTASHVVGDGKKGVQITVPQIAFKIKTSIHFNSPEDDIALIKVHLTEKDKLGLKMFADMAIYMTGNFSAKGFRPTGDTPHRTCPREFISVVLDNEFKIIPVTGNLVTKTTNQDTYISGAYRRVMLVPIFGRPGMSGAPFFKDQGFAGIMSKVDLSPSSESYVIPVAEITRILQEKLFSKNPKPINSRWDIAGGRLRLNYSGDDGVVSYTSGDKIVEGGRGGGEVGNVGGSEVGNVGGSEVGNVGGGGSLWKIHVFTSSTSSSMLTTYWNHPFVYRKPLFSHRGNNYAYFTEGSKYVAATFATYRFLSLRSGNWKMNADNAENLAALERARQESDLNPRFARIYTKVSANEFGQASRGHSTRTGDGTAAIDEKNEGFRILPKAPGERFAMIARSLNWTFRLSNDLKKMTIRNAAGVLSALNLQAGTGSLNRTFYIAPGGGNRAVIYWNAVDLAKMQRILVDTPSHLFELIACNPDKGGDCYH